MIAVESMSLLNNPVALTITVSLAIQIIVLFLLVYGYYLMKKLKFRNHGIMMTAALILHLSMVLYVMIPSFVLAVVPEYIVSVPLALPSFVGLIHGILGIATLLIGIWIVASWRFQKNLKGCFDRKKIMLKTLVIWGFSSAFGIILYAIFIGPLLNS
jgi:hypothetical protein